ncbi:glutamine synthetase, type I [Thermogladius calderae 1633]|uniref:Glutamine synthetase, type I n=1 Tax=Thermogladius calderae (strain DSM 22663 / VKM B-2946 / 1633) TaxID=1184251 RepID=I3TG78_THEC1|nr:glutamine synthetase, type I [Thermogladius calderae 1633]
MLTHLLFTDLAGRLRKVTLRIDGDPLLLEGLETIVDGSSLLGFLRVEESDLLVKPVSSRPIVTGYVEGKHFISGLYKDKNTRYNKDPRFVAERLVEYLKEVELEARVGVELEFYIVESVESRLTPVSQSLNVKPIGEADYPQSSLWFVKTYDSPGEDKVGKLLGRVLAELERNELYFSKVHRENGPRGQVEVSTPAGTPIETADFVQHFKYMARVVGGREGFRPVFLAKPFPDDYGSGMHVHVSLWQGASNIFEEEGKLSDEALYFIGGLLEHARSLAAFTNPTVNSYRRLVEGFEAPVYVSWGLGNRTTAIRVPTQHQGRVEYRPPDPTSNPYLSISAIIMAGLDGIRKKISPSEPTSRNLFEEAAGWGTGGRVLPRSLEEALEELEADNDYLQPVFDRELLESYIELKKREAKAFRSYPTPVDYLFYLEY